jgi:hypothetical protein
MTAHTRPPERTGSVTVPLRVEVTPECDVRIGQTDFKEDTRGEPGFRQLSGNTTFRYRIRTGSVNGGGAILFRLDGPGKGSTLDYKVSIDRIGTALSGAEGGASEVVLARFGPNAHTTPHGAGGAVSWQIRQSASEAATVPVARLRCAVH